MGREWVRWSRKTRQALKHRVQALPCPWRRERVPTVTLMAKTTTEDVDDQEAELRLPSLPCPPTMYSAPTISYRFLLSFGKLTEQNNKNYCWVYCNGTRKNF